MRSPRHQILVTVAALALLGSVAACSTDKSDTGGSTAAGATPAKAKAKTKKAAVDACTLLKKDEIEAIIGANDGGHHGGGVGESVCEWDNNDTEHSVTVAIGNPGTAAGGKLPVNNVPGAGTPDKGPDGISFDSDNTANFVAGERACYVQVVTDPTSNKDRDTAVRLIKLVRARTSGKL